MQRGAFQLNFENELFFTNKASFCYQFFFRTLHSEKTIWLIQQNFDWFNHRIYLLYGQQNVWLIQHNICLIQSNCLVVLTKSEYLVDSTKKFVSIKQNLFDLTKFS